jgi:hypothetical protein
MLVMFGGAAPGQFQQPLLAEIGWPTIWSLLAVVVVTALALTLVAYWRAHNRQR